MTQWLIADTTGCYLQLWMLLVTGIIFCSGFVYVWATR